MAILASGTFATAPKVRDIASLRQDDAGSGGDLEKIIHIDRYIIDWDQVDVNGVPLASTISAVNPDENLFNPRKAVSWSAERNIADATFLSAAGVTDVSVVVNDGENPAVAKDFQIKSSSFMFYAPMLDSWMVPSATTWPAFSEFCILLGKEDASSTTRQITIKDSVSVGTDDWTIGISTGRGDTVTYYDVSHATGTNSTTLTASRIAETAGGPMISTDPITKQASNGPSAGASITWGGLQADVSTAGLLTLTVADADAFTDFRRVTVKKAANGVSNDWDAFDIIAAPCLIAAGSDRREPTGTVNQTFDANYNFELTTEEFLGTWASGVSNDSYWTPAGVGGQALWNVPKPTWGVNEGGDNLRHYHNQKTIWHVLPFNANLPGQGRMPGYPTVTTADDNTGTKVELKQAELPGDWLGATSGNAVHLKVDGDKQGTTLYSRPVGKDEVSPGGYLRFEFNMAIVSDAPRSATHFPGLAYGFTSSPVTTLLPIVVTLPPPAPSQGWNTRKFENSHYFSYGKWRKHVVGMRIPEFGHDCQLGANSNVDLVDPWGYNFEIMVIPDFSGVMEATHTFIIDNIRITAMNSPLMDLAIGAAELPLFYSGANPYANFGGPEPQPPGTPAISVQLAGSNGIQFQKGWPITGTFDIANASTALDVNFNDPNNAVFDTAGTGVQQNGWLARNYPEIQQSIQPGDSTPQLKKYQGYTTLVSDPEHTMMFPGPSATAGGVDRAVCLSRRNNGVQPIANYQRQYQSGETVSNMSTWKSYRSAIRAGYIDLDAADEALTAAANSATVRQENAPSALAWRAAANDGEIVGPLMGFKFYLQSTAATHKDNPYFLMAAVNADGDSGFILNLCGPAINDEAQSGNPMLWQEIYGECTFEHLASPDARDRMDIATQQLGAGGGLYNGTVTSPNLNMINIEFLSLSYNTNVLNYYNAYTTANGLVGTSVTISDIPERFGCAWLYLDNFTMYMAQELPSYYEAKSLP